MATASDDANIDPRILAARDEAKARRVARLSARRVYVVEAEGLGLIKIGTAVDVPARMSDLQVSCPVPLRLLGVIPGTAHEEKRIHAMLAEDRQRGEWFTLTPSVREVLTELGFAMEGEVAPMPVSDSNVQLRVLLPHAIYAELFAWAEESFDSLSNLVRHVLREALKDRRVGAP